MSVLNAIEVVTLFVDDIDEARAFYQTVFAAEVIYTDAVSQVLNFNGLWVNLLQISQASQLVSPLPVAPSQAGSRMLLTIRVVDVDAVCDNLSSRGIALLNGPIDRPWGRRTAAFADPSGHVWEVAHELG